MAEALSTQELGRIVRKYWLVLLAIIAVGGVAGYFGARLIPPTYTATATQLVKGIPGTDATANYQAAQYAISRARTYPLFIGSQPVLEGVRSDFNGSVDVGDLQPRLSASNPVDTPLIQVTATAPTADEARDMANSAARHLARYITQIETVNGSSPVTVEVAVQATRPSEQSAPRPLLIATLIAFAAGCFGLASLLLLDRLILPTLARRRRRKELSSESDDNEAAAAGLENPDSVTASATEPDTPDVGPGHLTHGAEPGGAILGGEAESAQQARQSSASASA